MATTLFKRCLGLNDARAFGTQKMITNPRDPEVGSVELTDCLNLTTTDDGAVEKIAPFVTAITHSAPITAISAGKRFLFTDGVDTREWTTGTTVVNRFPATTGPMVHTVLDCRVSTASKVYKSVHPAVAMAEAVVGTNPNPATSKAFAGQPAFDHAFTYNAKLYSVNHADPRFLQCCEDYHYDLWNLADGFVGHLMPVLQAGAIPGVMLTLHDSGVTVYPGSGPADFAKRFYPCDAIDGTLFSGFISKVYGYGHIFLCSDGVYAVLADGELKNLTVSTAGSIGTLNSSYSCATVQDGKYLVFGNALCIEYDFQTKAVMKRSSGVTSATGWNGINYYAVGSTVATMGTAIDTGSIAASLTLPFSDWGSAGAKSISDFYFTGTIGGDVLLTATDNVGKSWEVNVSGIGEVSNYRIKTPKGMLGNHISLKIDCTSGAFRMEELAVVVAASKRSR